MSSIHRPGARRRSALLVAVAALSLIVTACSPGGGTDPEDSEAPTANRDAELSIPMQAAPASLEPSQLAEGQQAYIWASVYDTLLLIDNDNEVQPNAAESYEYSEDRTTLTLHLRDDLTFSDGSPITAADAVATLEKTRSTPGQQQPKLAHVTSVSAPDDLTVVIELDQPDHTLLDSLAAGTGVIAQADNLEEEGIALRPLESGPYTFADATVDGTTYVLERRDDYWNAEAYPFKTVTAKVIQDQTAVFNALQAGELNAGGIQVAQKQAAEGAGLTVTQVDAIATLALIIADRDGTIQPALADTRVRQAINYAFDRDVYLQNAFDGVGQTTVQAFNPNGAAYNEDVADYYDYDPDKARELLAEAGYADGFELTLPSTVISQAQEPNITQSLGDIGITVNWEPVPPQNTAASVASAQYPVFLWFLGLGGADSLREINDLVSPTAFLNPFHHETQELNALLESAVNETDDAARADIYQDISAYSVENALAAPILYTGQLWATAEGVEYLPKEPVLNTIRTFGVTG